jgi:hypothetical protein
VARGKTSGFTKAIRSLPLRLSAEHREVLTLSVSGLFYDEAAAVCGCAVGTMRSRTSRARNRLAQTLDDRSNCAVSIGFGNHTSSLKFGGYRGKTVPSASGPSAAIASRASAGSDFDPVFFMIDAR